ncbi:hypothetical protein GCM10010211_55080 [Streptomyces albospinus]|uniref:Uncharacterized protein n=1 Tax=Streptomyces albospinus TaxID=285515 RepID=A0ABQ2VGD5_9ACTN|nr:hypothetical protein GCM10010211_55080 [Streptomyces albospinus]
MHGAARPEMSAEAWAVGVHGAGPAVAGAVEDDVLIHEAAGQDTAGDEFAGACQAEPAAGVGQMPPWFFDGGVRTTRPGQFVPHRDDRQTTTGKGSGYRPSGKVTHMRYLLAITPCPIPDEPTIGCPE